LIYGFENIKLYFKKISCLGWLIFFVSLIFFPVVVEEIVFRGVLLKNLTFKYGFKVAVLATCIIFSSFHGVSNFICIFPKINYISGDSPNKTIFLFIFALPFILRKLYQFFILEKNSFKF